MSDNQLVWKIRILSGFHAGAELVLPDEVNALGRGDECDLVLDDPSLAKTHIGLTPLANTLRLRLLDESAPTYVDGQPVEGEVDLAPFQIVSIGTVHIAVGPARDDWPKLDIPTLRVAEPEAPAAPAAEEQRDPPAEQKPLPETSAPPPTTAPGRRTPRQLLPRFAAMAVGAGGLIVAAFLSFGTPTDVERTQLDADVVLRTVNDLAKRLGAHVTVELPDEPTGLPTVTGFSKREQDRLHFEKELQQAGIRARIRLTSNTRLLRSARALINQITIPGSDTILDAAPAPHFPGRLIISGYAETDQTIPKLKRLLESEISTHRGFTFSVESQDHREAILQERLSELRLQEELHIQDIDNGIAFFGPAPSPGEMGRLRALVEEFNHEFDSRPRLTLPGTTTFLGKSTIELEYRAVILGESGNHLITRNGEARIVGETIMGHWTIANIDPRYIILERASNLKIRGKRAMSAKRAFYVVEETQQS